MIGLFMAFHCPRCRAEIDRNFKACPHCGEPITDFLRRYADEPIDGKYKIIERLGAGGMGEVYKVEHTFLGTTRVVKVIRPQIAESSEAHDRFLREAKLATRVQHPNVATIQDFAELPDHSHYMVSDFIEGENIAQIVRRQGVLPARRAVRLAAQAARGLDAIHKAGIVHRDISPENLMVTHNDEVKIIDLGVAKSEDIDHAVTKTGIFVGKLRYASPEHLGILADGDKIDGRADVYSLGVVLFEMLTGRPPFEATSPHQYLMHHASGSQVIPIPVLPPDMPANLKSVLLRALERDRTKRFATAGEMANALDQIEQSLTGTQADATLLQTPVPAPARAPAAPTIITRPPAVAPSKKNRGALYAGIGVAFLLAFAVVAVVFVLLMKPRSQPAVAAVPPVTVTVAAAPPAPATAAQTTIEVTQTQPPVTTTTATAAPPPSGERTSRPLTPETVTTPAPAPAPAPTSTRTEETSVPHSNSSVVPYIEGGDGDANETAIANAQHALNGTHKVAIRGSDAALTAELARILTKHDLTVADGADVVIRFDGALEHLGRGRKRRSATASITK